jgi:hypothetical protein
VKTRTLFVVLMLIILVFSGCSRTTVPAVAGEVKFERLNGAESKKFQVDLEPLKLGAEILDEDKNSIYVAVNIPFNSDIQSIEKKKSGEMVINLKMKPEMENQDPFLTLAPSDVCIFKISKGYKEDFEKDRIVFAVKSKALDRVVDYQSALSQAWDYMETDFTSTLNCLALYRKDGEISLSYIFFFGDTENINRAGNELISGVVALDAVNGQLLEYRIFSRKNLPGTYRFAERYKVEGWKDSLTMVVLGSDEQEYFLLDMLGSPEPIKNDEAAALINSYDRSVNSLPGYSFSQENSENDLGFIYTKEAYVIKTGSSSRMPVDIPQNTNIVSKKWDRKGRNLYFTTEMAEPSYGNFWTYYTLWRFSLRDGGLMEVGKLPTGEFYLSPDGSKLSYNGLEGDLFILDIKKIDAEDSILK